MGSLRLKTEYEGLHIGRLYRISETEEVYVQDFGYINIKGLHTPSLRYVKTVIGMFPPNDSDNIYMSVQDFKSMIKLQASYDKNL